MKKYSTTSSFTKITLSTLALVSIIVPVAVFAAVSITSVTFNSAATATVEKGKTVTTTVNANFTTSTTWSSTSYRVATTSGSTSCDTSANATGTGAKSSTFSITTPNSIGTFNAYISLYTSSNCSGSAFASTTILNAITTIPDVTAPILSSASHIGTTTDTTPNFSFSSNEAGTIIYGGDCSASNTTANVGNNTLQLHTLSLGTHTNCTIVVKDSSNNASLPLSIPSFTVIAPSLPDLTVTKTNSATSGTVLVGNSFNWIITITNSGTASSTFSNNNTLFTDNMPTSGATYGIVATSTSGTTGKFDCTIASSNLTCTAKSTVTIPVSGTITITVPVTATTTGSLVNPRTGAGNICKVDPSFGNGVVNESNENNNTCADTVSVIVPPTITITPATLATGIVGTSYGQTLNAVTTALPPFTWTILSGALPGGLSLGSTGNSTDLTGTPTTAGTFNFTANVTNGTSSSTQAYAISIAPAVATTTPPITGANLIINPQVETISTTTPTLPYAWTNGGFGTNTAVYTYPATNTPVSEIANGNAIRVSVTNYTDGDAKWIFNPVAVTPNDQYVFTDAYISDVPTQLAAEFLDAQGNVISFGGWATVPPSSSWTNATAKFTAPAGSAFMTVFHLLQSNGTLTTDNYNLIALPPSIPFDNGMVSITFDDGWKSQYENAFPILQNAGLKGSFYIITNAIAATSEDNPNVLCNDPAQTSCNGATIIATPSVWTAGTQYPDPAQKTYTFADTYTATTTSTITISYFDQNGQPISGQQNIVLGTAPAGTSQTTSLTFTIPDSVFSIISTSTTPHTSPLFSISHAVTAGQTITVTNGSLREPASPVDSYMSAAQILALQSAGDEVSAHTQDHCNLALLYSNPNLATSTGCASPQATAKTALEEISGSRSAMLALGATPVDTFVYPYGGFDANIETLVQQTGFVGARSVLLGYNTRGSDKYALNTQIIDAKLTTDPNGLATAKAWIDYAKANKVWLILTLHGVFTQNQWNGNVALNPNSVNDATTDTFFQNVVNYLKQSSVCVVTFHDGMQAMNSTTNPCTPVVVPPTNSAPTLDPINNQTVATGTPVAFTAHGVDLDVGDTLTYGISSLPTGATFNTTTGVFSWTPTSSDIGAHVFTVTVTDNHGAKATQDVTITVTVPVIIPTNHAPVANNLTATTTKNTALSVHLVATDADGDVVTYATSTNPTHGTLTGTLPLLTYTPATDFVGIDSFTFTAHDATSTSNIATVTINIASTSSATTTDTIAPIITLNGASTTNLTLGSAYTELGATALDNVDTTTPITIGGDTVNINLAGTYHVTYDAVDSSGNHAIQMIRTIIINSPAPTPTPTPAPASGGGGGGGNGPIAVKTYGIFDFNNLLINWGKTGAGLAGDFNGDNTVDLLDFNLMLTNWTK